MPRLLTRSLALCAAVLLTPPLVLAAPKKQPDRCSKVDLLDAGIGPWRATMTGRLFRAGFTEVGYETAQKQRAKTEVFSVPECKAIAAKVATALGFPADSVQPLTWKAKSGVVVAAAALEHAAADEALFTAIEAGDVAGAKAALARGVDVDVRSQKGKNPGALMLAAQKGSLELVRLLLENGFAAAGLSSEDRPLVEAARAGQVPLMQVLLERGAPLDDAYPFGRPLCAALSKPEAVKLLLARGASPNTACGEYQSPEVALSVAVERDQVETVKLLLAAGADPNLGTPETHWTALFNVKTAEVARLLLAAGAKVNPHDNLNYTPLHTVISLGKEKAALVALLLEHGADPRAVDHRGWTPLHTAALDVEEPALLELLVKKGAPLDALSKQAESAPTMMDETPEWTVDAGSTALDVAVAARRVKAAAVLAKLGVKQRTTKGQPLPTDEE